MLTSLWTPNEVWDLTLRQLYSLITQHDSYLQSKLAQESLRDSKAMKTLSILTILFLPGAFVATLFSTDMFTFRDQMQQIQIYFAVVVPLTAVLIAGWLLWLQATPVQVDEEARPSILWSKARDLLKGGKQE